MWYSTESNRIKSYWDIQLKCCWVVMKPNFMRDSIQLNNKKLRLNIDFCCRVIIEISLTLQVFRLGRLQLCRYVWTLVIAMWCIFFTRELLEVCNFFLRILFFWRFLSSNISNLLSKNCLHFLHESCRLHFLFIF